MNRIILHLIRLAATAAVALACIRAVSGQDHWGRVEGRDDPFAAADPVPVGGKAPGADMPPTILPVQPPKEAPGPKRAPVDCKPAEFAINTLPAIPAPPVCTGSGCRLALTGSAMGPSSPIDQAAAKIVADTRAWEATAGSLSLATSARRQAEATEGLLISSTTAALAQVDADRAAFDALLHPPAVPPSPAPAPASTSTLEIVEVGHVAGCVFCDQFKPIFNALVAEGVPIRRVDADSKIEAESTEAITYAVDAVPTFVMLRDGKEVQRFSGTTSQTAMEKWFRSWQTLVKDKDQK
jgi:hypothetical protein